MMEASQWTLSTKLAMSSFKLFRLVAAVSLDKNAADAQFSCKLLLAQRMQLEERERGT